MHPSSVLNIGTQFIIYISYRLPVSIEMFMQREQSSVLQSENRMGRQVSYLYANNKVCSEKNRIWFLIILASSFQSDLTTPCVTSVLTHLYQIYLLSHHIDKEIRHPWRSLVWCLAGTQEIVMGSDSLCFLIHEVRHLIYNTIIFKYFLKLQNPLNNSNKFYLESLYIRQIRAKLFWLKSSAVLNHQH